MGRALPWLLTSFLGFFFSFLAHGWNPLYSYKYLELPLLVRHWVGNTRIYVHANEILVVEWDMLVLNHLYPIRVLISHKNGAREGLGNVHIDTELGIWVYFPYFFSFYTRTNVPKVFLTPSSFSSNQNS